MTATSTTTTLDGVPESVALARQWVRDECALHGLDRDSTDGAVLVASELATNAVLHSHSADPGGTYTLTAEFKPTELHLTVTDAGGDGLPQVRKRDSADLDEPRNHGQGLLLVEHHTHWWRALKHPNHHTITANIPTTHT